MPTFTSRERTVRTMAGLLVECGDAREVHHMALLVGYGAGAINPYLAFESIEDLIAEEMHGLVLEQFVRAHPEVADGTGLGLAIVQAAVEQINGRVWLESTPGAGTTVHFTVVDPPAAREE